MTFLALKPIILSIQSFLPSDFHCKSLTKFICAVYLSPNSSDYVKFFDYMSSKVEYILSHFPYAEISILGDIISFGYQLISLTKMVNKSSTLLSLMT